MSEWLTRRQPEPPHPFPHSASNDEWVIVSGTVGYDAEGNMPEDAAEQARAAIGNLVWALGEAGSSLAEIVYIKPYVTKREYAFEIDPVLRELLPDPKPACGALTVVGLADARMKVEFDAWAHRGATLQEVKEQ